MKKLSLPILKFHFSMCNYYIESIPSPARVFVCACQPPTCIILKFKIYATKHYEKCCKTLEHIEVFTRSNRKFSRNLHVFWPFLQPIFSTPKRNWIASVRKQMGWIEIPISIDTGTLILSISPLSWDSRKLCDTLATRGALATQRHSCPSQHLWQRNTSEQIERIELIFEGATILRILLITSVQKLS